MSEDALEASEAFEVLGDDVRLAVLRRLAEAPEPLSFSELRDEVGIRDSGRFNYHLDRLRGHFVRKTEAGYELRYHGQRVVETILAGTFTDSAEVGPFPVTGTCYACDGALEGVYEDEHVTIDCVDCGERVLSVGFPPSALEGRDPEALMAAYERWSVARVAVAADGVCPVCSGATERQLQAGGDLPFDLLLVFECVACRARQVTSFAALALRTPAVESFYAERGVDIDERPYWDIEPCITGEYTTVHSRDPLDVEVAFPAAGDRLVVRLGPDLEVVETRLE